MPGLGYVTSSVGEYSIYSQLQTMPYIIVDMFLQCKWTSLHRACQEGHTQVAELLLQAGASVDLETKVRWRAMQSRLCCDRAIHITKQCTLYMCNYVAMKISECSPTVQCTQLPTKVGFSAENLIQLLCSLSGPGNVMNKKHCLA